MGAERYHSQAAAEFAVGHYRETGKIILHGEAKAIMLKKKRERAETKAREHDSRPARGAVQQEEMRL
jgi:hypothetical protein